MSLLMDDEIKRSTARRKSALAPEIIQGKTMVAEASGAYDLDRAPGRGVRVVSLGSIGLVLSAPLRIAERADCLRVTADLQRKFKRLRQRPVGARAWLSSAVRRNPMLFPHWQLLYGNGRMLGA